MPRPRFQCRCGRSAYSPICGNCRLKSRPKSSLSGDPARVVYGRHKEPLIRELARRVARGEPLFPSAKGA